MNLIASFSFCLPVHWWWKWFKRSVWRSASVDIIWVTRHDRDSGEQLTWIKQSLPQRYVCVGCQLNKRRESSQRNYYVISPRVIIKAIIISDQARRLLCLKEHIRARDWTLWQYRWQEVNKYWSTKTLGGSWAAKKIAKKNWKCFLKRAANVAFSS